MKEPFAPESIINFSNSSGDKSFFSFKESVFTISFLLVLKFVFNYTTEDYVIFNNVILKNNYYIKSNPN